MIDAKQLAEKLDAVAASAKPCLAYGTMQAVECHERACNEAGALLQQWLLDTGLAWDTRTTVVVKSHGFDNPAQSP